MSAALEVHDLQRSVGDRVIITKLSFTVQEGEVLFVRGPSGVGKSLLLRALACLDPYQAGKITLNGKIPEQWGFPQWRAHVAYVPQSRVTLKGTPSELYFSAQQLKAQRRRSRGDLPALIHDLGLEQSVLNQPWSELSGGQAQRVVLAICLALKPTFLLLDEPTAALDTQSTLRAERVLRACGAGLVWVTHDDVQPGRVGGRLLQLPLGTEAPLDSIASSIQAQGVQQQPSTPIPYAPAHTPIKADTSFNSGSLETDVDPITEADLSLSPSPTLFLTPGRTPAR